MGIGASLSYGPASVTDMIGTRRKMTIEITRPELEALIQERLRTGGFKDPQDAILEAFQRSSAGDLRDAILSPASADAESAPSWLKDSWRKARESGLDTMTMEEIDSEITAARLARRQPKQ